MDYRTDDTNYPLGIRCNNPLNVSDDNWQGQVGVYPNAEKEAIFSDTVYGLRAAAILLYNYYTKHNLTTIAGVISGIVSRWAPAGDTAAINYPTVYANYVANQSGIDANQSFDLNATNIKKIMQAMVKYELGPAFATMIPDSEYDQALTMANKKELLNKSIGLGVIILIATAGYYGLKYLK